MNDLVVVENQNELFNTDDKGVVQLNKIKAMDLFLAENGLDPVIEFIKSQAQSVVADINTKKGRDLLKSMAYQVTRSKTAIDAVRKDLVDDLKSKPKIIDNEGRRCREILDALAEEIKRPAIEFENAEKARIEGHQNFIISIASSREIYEHSATSDIQEKLEWLQSLTIDESLEEFEDQAHRELKASIDSVSKSLARRKKQEADQAELERLQKEAEEKARAEYEAELIRNAEENARKLAEEKAEQDRLNAEKAQRDAEERANKAEQDRIEAEEKAEQVRIELERKAQQAAIDAEQKLIREQEEQAKELARQKAAREADIEHRKKINNEILLELVKTGITEEQGKKIIEKIVRGEVPNTVINY